MKCLVCRRSPCDWPKERVVGSHRRALVTVDRLPKSAREVVERHRDAGHTDWKELLFFIDAVAPVPESRLLEVVPTWRALEAACNGHSVWQNGVMHYDGVHEANLVTHSIPGHWEIEVYGP
jgi:hypothetical protein